MPGRIKVLAEAARAIGDPRPRCPKCGIGFVGYAASVKNRSDRLMYVGQCSDCGQRWYTAANGREIYNPVQD